MGLEGLRRLRFIIRIILILESLDRIVRSISRALSGGMILL